VEQPQTRTTPAAPSRTWRVCSFHGALLTTLLALVGCGKPTQRAVIAVPAARQQGAGRPLRLLPPFELASQRDAVVRVVSDVTCTGTLIADDRVLTAHHCVAERDARGHVLDRNKSPEEIEIELGGDYLPWGEVKVKAIVSPDCGYASGDGDIAILVLTRHLIGMPTSAARIEAAPEVKDDLAVFGFGRCALSSTGGDFSFQHPADPVHRATRDAGKIDKVFSGQFGAQASICPGDSGGPVYSSRGDLIGVVSASVMDGDDRTQGASLFTRVDVWPQLFSAAHEISLGASPGELPPYGDCRVRAHAPAR
jgi:hypothetical protein